jgi:Xaa-Pro aminopeptidase
MNLRHLCLIASIFASQPAAQEAAAPPQLPPAFHRGRRLALMEKVGTGVIVVRGSAEPGDYLPLIQNHEFFYLTGVRDPSCELILVPETREEILFLPGKNRFTETWVGPRLHPGERARELTGFARVENRRRFRAVLTESLAQVNEKVIHVPLRPEVGRSGALDSAALAATRQKSDEFDGRGTRADALRQALLAMFPDAEVRDVAASIDALRLIKTREEIEALRYSCRVAAAGVNEAMRSCRPGLYERQLAAAADFVFQREGAQAVSYGAIVGSGKNACILHYMKNDRVIGPAELVLLDFAPDCGGYVSDLTRTFPSDGKFTPAQRKLYEDVLAAQEAILARVRPGASFAELTRAGNEVLVQRGYKPSLEIKHGPCHFVGLAVHDVGATNDLEEGMVFTVEPGAYLDQEGMGVRIEDVILVTRDGYENLTQDAPRAPEAIERLMAKRGILERD